jgi:hypothetical protein
MSRAPSILKNPGFSPLTFVKGGAWASSSRWNVYEGRCNKNRDDYAAALVRFAASYYVLSDKPHRFVVDGQHNDVISGPARSNDNFDIVNCYFAYNPTLRRLELITRAPLEKGIYEALTNYDTPGEFPAYWTAELLFYLSEEEKKGCEMSPSISQLFLKKRVLGVSRTIIHRGDWYYSASGLVLRPPPPPFSCSSYISGRIVQLK